MPNNISHLTEYQIWMLRDALARGCIYLASRDDLEDGMFPRPDDPKGYAIPPHDSGQKRILRNLVKLELLREETPGRFVLTDSGRQFAMHDDTIAVRRSY